MTKYDIGQIVDLARYPIDRVESDEAQQLLVRCRQATDNTALCMLPGFIQPNAVKVMAEELDGLVANASRYDEERIAYAEPTTEIWPAGHPQGRKHVCRYYQLLNYQIPNDSPLRRLYYWPPLTEFLRRMMGYEEFYRSDCPHLALTAKLADEGDMDGWHFDGTDVAFSLMLQEPEAGGEFEYLPYLRTETEQNYDAVATAFDNPDRLSVRHTIKAGTLTVFKGDLSLHRVTSVEGGRRRIVALFSYHHQPGHVFHQYYIERLHAYMRPPDSPIQ